MRWKKSYKANKIKIDDLIREAKSLDNDLKQSVYFEILIIKISALIEISFRDIISDYCMKHADKNIKNFMYRQADRHFNSPTFSLIWKWLNSFKKSWAEEFEKFGKANTLDFERLERLIELRNRAAHTHRNINTTLKKIRNYNRIAQAVIEKISEIVSGKPYTPFRKGQR